MRIIKSIQNRIYEIRGEKVMLDFDLAALFGVNVNVLNLSVKRHSKLFPEKSMFQLTEKEWQYIKYRIETIESSNSLKPQIVTLKTGGEQHSKFLSHAFTGQGVAILRGIFINDTNDIQINQLYDAMKNLLDKNAGQKKWEERERIGFI